MSHWKTGIFRCWSGNHTDRLDTKTPCGKLKSSYAITISVGFEATAYVTIEGYKFLKSRLIRIWRDVRTNQRVLAEAWMLFTVVWIGPLFRPLRPNLTTFLKSLDIINYIKQGCIGNLISTVHNKAFPVEVSFHFLSKRKKHVLVLIYQSWRVDFGFTSLNIVFDTPWRNFSPKFVLIPIVKDLAGNCTILR